MRAPLFYRNAVYAMGLCLILLTFFTLKTYGKRPKNEFDFLAAKHIFLRWEQSLGKQEKLLQDLLCLLKKHPELQAEYQAKIAQNLVAWREGRQAKELGIKALERTSQPYFREYAECSLLVAEKHLKIALERSLLLKKRMLEDGAFLGKGWEIKGCGAALFSFNLMRIATLYQGMGMGKPELEAWRELKAYAGFGAPQKNKEISSEGFKSLLNHFTVGSISLLDYISWREEQLTN